MLLPGLLYALLSHLPLRFLLQLRIEFLYQRFLEAKRLETWLGKLSGLLQVVVRRLQHVKS